MDQAAARPARKVYVSPVQTETRQVNQALPVSPHEPLLPRADYSAEALGQFTLARFIDSGGLARHLRLVRPVYRARRDRLLAAI